MTTLAELIAEDPDPTFGRAVPEIVYGTGTWRIAFMIANPRAGASVAWHDLTGPVSSMAWTRGAAAARGRFQAVEPTVLINAVDDRYAPWNPDTSSTFGVHVPLRAGLLMRASVFRVVDDAVDLCFHLFTSRVRRWRDQQAANGGYRFHRVDGIDLMSYLVQAPAGANTSEGWKQRIDDVLSDADWPFGADIYGAETSDASTTLQLPERDAQDSAIAEVDATLDPVGLTWRTRASGKFIAHPWPWDSFHADLFGGMTTIVGSEYTSPIETYYPGGPTFSYLAADGEVQFVTEPEGQSFGVDSDLENVANEWTITHPVDVTNLASGYTVSAYDDAVSAGYFGRRAIPAASWLAENDTVQQDMVDAFAYTDLTAAPLAIDIRHANVFPAIAVLDHLDPCEIRHASRPGRTELTVSGSLRQISHEIRVWGPNVLWRANVQTDIDAESTATPLNPVQNLAVNTPVTENYAEFTWTNPSQTTTPTETQVRITGLSTTWLDLAYPGTGAAGFDWLSLAPSTLYEFEVRLVRRVNDVIVAVSPARSVVFQTASPTVPVYVPGGGGTISIPTGEYSCDTIEWKLEESSDGGSSWSTVDSGDDSDFDAEDILDLSAFSFVSGRLYRVCTRCDGTMDAWDCSDIFQVECDAPGALSSAPFNDASLEIFVPKICDGEIYEAVADALGYRGPAFGQITNASNGEYALMSDGSQGGIVAYGPADATIGLTDDASYGITVSLGNVPASGSPIALWRCGGMQIEALYESSTTWRVRARTFIASGGSITTTSSDPLNLDTEYVVLVTHDVSEQDVTLYVDGTEAATGTAGTRNAGLAVWVITLPADSYATAAAVWSSMDVSDFDTFTSSLNPQHWWKGDEASSSLADSGIGTALTLNPSGSPTYQQSVGSFLGPDCNGTSYFGSSTNPGTDDADFTFVSLVKLDGMPGTGNNFPLVHTGQAAASKFNEGLLVLLLNDGSVYARVATGSGSGATATTGVGLIGTSGAHMIAVVYDGSTLRIFVDGGQEASVSWSSGVDHHAIRWGYHLGNESAETLRLNGRLAHGLWWDGTVVSDSDLATLAAKAGV